MYLSSENISTLKENNNSPPKNMYIYSYKANNAIVKITRTKTVCSKLVITQTDVGIVNYRLLYS